MLKKIKIDYSVYLNKPPNLLNLLLAFIKISGFRVTVLYRLAHALKLKKLRVLSGILTRLIRISAPVDIEVSAEIGYGLSLPHPLCIVIGSKVKIGNHCKIMQGVSLGGSLGKKKSNGQSQPIIGNNVILGAGAKIIGPVVIGNDVVIGANSVVTKDIPSGAIAFGIPAVIR